MNRGKARHVFTHSPRSPATGRRIDMRYHAAALHRTGLAGPRLSRPTSLPMTSSTDLSREPSPRSSRHPSLALPCHPREARPGNTTWRGLASLAGWKQDRPHG